MITKFLPDVHEFIITAKNQTEVHIDAENIQKAMQLQAYLQKVFFKEYEINMLTFITILKEKNFIHKISLKFEHLILDLNVPSDDTSVNQLQLAFDDISFRLESYQQTSQFHYFINLHKLLISHNGSLLLQLNNINPQNRAQTLPFKAFETQLKHDEDYHIKIVMLYEDKQKNKNSKIQIFQYGWETTFYIDNLVKQALKLKKLVSDLKRCLKNEDNSETDNKVIKEDQPGHKNVKYNYFFSFIFAHNIIKADTEENFSFLSNFAIIFCLNFLENLFPTKFYLSFSIEAKIKIRAILTAASAEVKFHQLSAEDPLNTPRKY